MRLWALMLLVGCSENGLSSLESVEQLPDSDEPAAEDTANPLPPVADAGPDSSVNAGDSVDLDGTASFDSNGGALIGWQWSLLSAPPDSASGLPFVDQSIVSFLPDVHGTYEFELTVENDAGMWDATPDVVAIEAAAAPPIADAGPDAAYGPLTKVWLDGTASYDPEGLEPLTYAWTLVSKPLNSNAALSSDTLAKPTFFAELAGDYVFDLVVTNTVGLSSTVDTVTISTAPADGFYVEASWTGNGDIDLHLLSSKATDIFDCPNDCNWADPSPAWGAPGPADDPELDEDTIPGVSGSGPEIITIDTPATDVYTVMVHYYGKSGSASCSNCPDATTTVNIYLGGVLAGTYTGLLLEDDDVWEVATIEWPSGFIVFEDDYSTTSRTGCF